MTGAVRLSISITLVATLTWMGGTSAAKLYRWVDENGEVHYTDTLPPEQAGQAHQQLNQQGVTVQSVEKAKSREQLAAEKQAQEEAARRATEAELARKLQAERDRALLHTYVSEQDIIESRDRNIATIEGTINLSTNNLEKLRAQAEALRSDLAQAQPGSAVATKVESALRQTEDQIRDFENFIGKKRAEQASLQQKFDEDLHRFRELRH